MAYLLPAEFATKMVDAGEAKIYMSTRDTLIRAYMAGAILALACAKCQCTSRSNCFTTRQEQPSFSRASERFR